MASAVDSQQAQARLVRRGVRERRTAWMQSNQRAPRTWIEIARPLERFSRLGWRERIDKVQGATRDFRNLSALESVDKRSTGAQFFSEREISTCHSLILVH